MCICRLPCCTFIISSFLFLLRKRVIEGSREVILFIGRYKMCFSSGAFRLTWKTEAYGRTERNKIKENQMVIGNRNIGQMYFSIWFFVIFFSSQFHPHAVSGISSFLQFLLFWWYWRCLLVILSMSLWICFLLSVFARLLALFLE